MPRRQSSGAKDTGETPRSLAYLKRRTIPAREESRLHFRHTPDTCQIVIINPQLLKKLAADLSIDRPFIKGASRPVRNCWHVSSDGGYAFFLFETEEDFKSAMNRLALLVLRSRVVVLAFCIMDNHVHFVLYGMREDCEAFAKEFLNLTAHYNSRKHYNRRGASSIPLTAQSIEDEDYLLNAICYDLRNPPVNGLRYTYFDYPWSSGPLYFRSASTWSSPLWKSGMEEWPKEVRGHFKVTNAGELGVKERKRLLGSSQEIPDDWLLFDGMVLPSSYIPVGLVEALFRSHRAFNYFVGRSKEKDMEEMMGTWSSLGLQDTEMRQHRDEEMAYLFGTDKIRSLSIGQRIEIGRILRRKYMTSVKQIARVVCIPQDVAERALM